MFEIRKLYFYLIAFISLLIVLFSTQSLANTLLQNYVFRTNPQYTYQPSFISSFFGYNSYPSYPMKDPYVMEQEKVSMDIIDELKAKDELTTEQKSALNNWLVDYERWKKDQEDYKRGMVNNIIGAITSIVIFTPVFLFHFKLARRGDTR